MFTQVAESTRKGFSALVAVAIVSAGALVLDQAHIAAAPAGTVEVGELTLVNEAEIASVTLPEVIVVAKREARPSAQFAATTALPEVVVVAKRVSAMVAQQRAGQRSALNAGAEGALLK
ncbi:MAG: hypothetical protein ACREVI_06795 [Steroidobacteraceae bacterium]